MSKIGFILCLFIFFIFKQANAIDNNLLFLHSQPLQDLLHAQGVLLDRMHALENYDLIFQGQPAKNDPAVEMQMHKAILKNLKNLHERLQQVHMNYTNQLTGMDKSCREYFRDQEEITSRLRDFLRMENPSSWETPLFSPISTQYIYRLHHVYLLAFSTQLMAEKAGAYVPPDGDFFNCVDKDEDRMALVNIALETANFYDIKLRNRYGRPAYLKSEGLANQYVNSWVFKNQPYTSVATNRAINIALVLGGGYFSYLTGEVFYSLGAWSSFFLNRLPNAAVAGTSTFFEILQLQMNSFDRNTLLEDRLAMVVLQTALLQPGQFEASDWISLATILDNAEIQPILKSRAEINDLCNAGKKCPPESLQKLRVRTQKRLEAFNYVISNYNSVLQ